MTWQYPLTSTSSATTVDLSTTDSAYVAQNVVITSTGGRAIEGDGSNHHVVVDGTVAGFIAVYLGTSTLPLTSGEVLEVSKTGKLFGGSGYGAALLGGSSQVTNDGTISGDYAALALASGAVAGVTTLKNTGTLSSAYVGVSIFSDLQEVDIDNSGTITGDYAIDGGYGVEKIVNSGSITGVINLKNGNDLYDGRTGSVVGAVNGGNGADRIYGGKEANIFARDDGKDRLYGAAGADKLTGGADADMFIFKRTTESTSSVRDTIYDFDHIDVIDLRSIDAKSSSSVNDAFKFIGSSAFHHKAGELRYAEIRDNTYVYGDTNGDAKIDFSIKLVGGFVMEKGDFLL